MDMSDMLEISLAAVPKGAPECPQGPLQGQLGALGLVGRALWWVKMTYFSRKNIVFQYKMLRITMKASVT